VWETGCWRVHQGGIVNHSQTKQQQGEKKRIG